MYVSAYLCKKKILNWSDEQLPSWPGCMGVLKRWLCLPNKVVIFVIFSPCVSQTPVVSYCSKHVVQSFADIKIFRFSSFSPLSDYYQFQYVGRWQSFPISSLLKHRFCLRSDDTFELIPEKIPTNELFKNDEKIHRCI